MKAFGAQKVYCIKQDVSTPESIQSVSERLKSELTALRESLNEQRGHSDELSKVVRKYTTFERDSSRRIDLLKTIGEIHQQISSIESSRPDRGSAIDSQSNVSGEALEKELAVVQILLDKRRRITKRMIGDICEQSGMSRSDLIGDLGLEVTRGC